VAERILYRGIHQLSFLGFPPSFRVMWRRLSGIDWNHHYSCVELSGKQNSKIIAADMLSERGEKFMWSFGKEHLRYFSKFCFILLTAKEHSFLQKLIEARLGRPRRRWVDNIRMDLQEVGCGYMDWIGLAQDRDRWRNLVSTVMKLRVPWNAGNFLTSCKPVSFPRRTLHHGVRSNWS